MTDRVSLRDGLALVFGAQWGQRIVIVGALVLYLWLALTSPETARAGVTSGLETFAELCTLILASLFLASALETVLPREAVASRLGGAAGPRSVVLAGVLGGALPGGPYAAYPIIRSVAERGASYPALVTMLIGYNLIGLGRVPFGLGLFDPVVVVTRVTAALLVTVAVGLALYALSETAVGGRFLS